jgi:hypothetical protein
VPYGYPPKKKGGGYPPSTGTDEADNVVDGVDNVKDGADEVTD